jgi:hypothetical protein
MSEPTPYRNTAPTDAQQAKRDKIKADRAEAAAKIRESRSPETKRAEYLARHGQAPAEEESTSPEPKQDDGDAQQMRQAIRRLEGQVRTLIARSAKPKDHGIIIAKTGDDPTAWIQQGINEGEIEELTDGLEAAEGDDAEMLELATMEGGEDAFFLIPMLDNVGGNLTTRYIKLTGDCVGKFAITGATQDGINMRWVYTMVEQEKSAAAYGGYTTKTGGLEIEVYNDFEEDNADTGLMGNGVTLDGDGLVDGTSLTLGPIPTGKGVHRVYSVPVPGGEPEYWFAAPNPLTGTCPPPV